MLYTFLEVIAGAVLTDYEKMESLGIFSMKLAFLGTFLMNTMLFTFFMIIVDLRTCQREDNAAAEEEREGSSVSIVDV